MRVLGGGCERATFRGLAEATGGLPTREVVVKCGRCTGEPQRVSLVAQTSGSSRISLAPAGGKGADLRKASTGLSRHGAPLADRSQTDNLDAAAFRERGVTSLPPSAHRSPSGDRRTGDGRQKTDENLRFYPPSVFRPLSSD